MAESHNKKWTLSPKSHHSMLSIPGPGSYNIDNALSTRASAPSFSMGGKYKSNTCVASSPGPGAYNIQGCLKKNNHGPVYAMKSKVVNSNDRVKRTSGFGYRSPPRVSQTPGPGSYNIDTYHIKVGPAYSMASRGHKPKQNKNFVPSPGPGAYNISSMGCMGSSYVISTWH
uniref:Uncharacterized protein n=1 Tax=Physcomitrium patens TaxID=3218 RepID=A0A2K1IU37_PHYPA|nr:hypothetical protein PHYPA_024731 [Physcomitrium patens]